MGRHPWQRWKSPPCCRTLLEAVKERSRQALPQPPPRALAASRSADCGEARQGWASDPWDASSTSCGTVPGHAGRAPRIPCRTPAPAGQAPSSTLPKSSQARSPEPTMFPPGRVGAGGEKLAWPCSSVPATHSDCRRFCTRGTTGTDHSFSEKALMLSCVQKTRAASKGASILGAVVSSTGWGREGGHLLSHPHALLSHVFSHACAKTKNEKLRTTPPPINQSFLGQSSVFSYAGAEEEEGAGRESSRRGFTFLHGSSWTEQLAPAATLLL